MFGVYAPGQAVSHLTYLGLFALQHRGQEAAGIVSFDGVQFHAHRAMGHVAGNFDRADVVATLAGRVAIVTGASKGIGLAVTEVLVDEGVAVVAGARRSSPELTRLARTGRVDFVATDAAGGTWYVVVAGALTSHRAGLQRTETVWKTLGAAHALRGTRGDVPLVLLTTHLPKRPSDGDTTLRAAGPNAFFDAVAMLDEDSRRRLALYARGGSTDDAQPCFWTAADLARRRRSSG